MVDVRGMTQKMLKIHILLARLSLASSAYGRTRKTGTSCDCSVRVTMASSEEEILLGLVSFASLTVSALPVREKVCPN